MQPVMAQRPVVLPPQYIPTQNVTYQAAINPRVAVRPPPPQPTYIQSVPYHVEPHISQAQIYSAPVQTVPIQGYIPQYQPVYVQGPPVAQQYAPYFNQYIQPVPLTVPVNSYPNTHPQMELNHNFDYEAANFLTDTKIVENSVFCVICGNNFKASEKDEHLKKHMRKTDTSTLLLDIPSKSAI